MSAIALAGGATGLAIYWAGTRLFFDAGGLFLVGALLLLSTFALQFGLVGVYRAWRSGIARADDAVMLAGVSVTALGLVSRWSIAAVGLALMLAASIRRPALPPLAFLLAFVGGALLAFEEVTYGALVAIRNDDPVAPGVPFPIVRALVASGFGCFIAGCGILAARVFEEAGRREDSVR